jgi:hypothetical protein
MIHTARGFLSFETRLLHSRFGHVVRDAFVPVAHQPPDEVRAHPAQSDHAELYTCSRLMVNSAT